MRFDADKSRLAAISASVNGTSSGTVWGRRTRQSDGLFLGSCDLSDIDRFHHRAEVGFIFAREAWGGGYGLESMSAVVTQAAALGLRRLCARTHAGNISSERLLQKLGFQAEGHLRGHIQRGGERRDCLVFGLLL